MVELTDVEKACLETKIPELVSFIEVQISNNIRVSDYFMLNRLIEAHIEVLRHAAHELTASVYNEKIAKSVDVFSSQVMRDKWLNEKTDFPKRIKAAEEAINFVEKWKKVQKIVIELFADSQQNSDIKKVG